MLNLAAFDYPIFFQDTIMRAPIIFDAPLALMEASKSFSATDAWSAMPYTTAVEEEMKRLMLCLAQAPNRSGSGRSNSLPRSICGPQAECRD
jgi:hypothetical protein